MPVQKVLWIGITVGKARVPWVVHSNIAICDCHCFKKNNGEESDGGAQKSRTTLDMGQ